jgi:hypothetical protein
MTFLISMTSNSNALKSSKIPRISANSPFLMIKRGHIERDVSLDEPSGSYNASRVDGNVGCLLLPHILIFLV